MSKPFSSTSRPATSAYSPSVSARVPREVAPRARSCAASRRVRAGRPEPDQPLARGVADGQEAVGVLEAAGRCCRCSPAAYTAASASEPRHAQPQPRPRVRARGSESRARRRGSRRRSRRTAGSCGGAAPCARPAARAAASARQPKSGWRLCAWTTSARAAADGVGHLIRLEPAPEQRPRRGHAARPGARALEQVTSWPWRRSSVGDVGDRSLLAPLMAVAVVEQEDAHGRRGRLWQRAPRPMAIALLTNYLAGTGCPLYERLAESHGLEVLCFGGGERYVPGVVRRPRRPAGQRALPGPPARAARARRCRVRPRRYETVIAPFAGGAILPAAYAGTRAAAGRSCCGPRCGRSRALAATPGAAGHAPHLPPRRRGGRLRRARAAIRRRAMRGHDDDIFVAPQSVEAELFARTVGAAEIARFRREPRARRWSRSRSTWGGSCPRRASMCCSRPGRDLAPDATLVLIGDGPLAERAAGAPGARLLGPLPRARAPRRLRRRRARPARPRSPRRASASRGGWSATRRCTRAAPMIATRRSAPSPAGWCATARPASSSRRATRRRSPAPSTASRRSRSPPPARRRPRARPSRPTRYDAMVEAFDRALAAAFRRRR